MFLTPAVVAVLLCVAVVGGVLAGLGAPGGTALITALFVTTELSPAHIAGTASAIFVAASLTATGLYTKSGDMDLDVLVPLIPTTLLGTQLGVYLNQYLPRDEFGIVIALLLLVVGVYIITREYYDLPVKYTIDPDKWRDRGVLAVLGGIVGTIGGVTGIGGLTLTVPALLLLGVPALVAISTGIAQSVFLTIATTIGYLSAGAVEFELVVVLGVPFVLAQVIGWRIAHIIKTERLVIVLGVVFVILAGYLLI